MQHNSLFRLVAVQRSVFDGKVPGKAASRFAAVGLRCAVLAISLLAVGCGKKDVGTIAGTVTVDGVPAKSGAISFYPTNGKARTAGAEIRDGQYTAEVAPGSAKVEIRVPKVIGQKKLYDTPNSPIQPILAEVLPAKYNDNSELTVEIKLGENEQNFDLKTK